MEGAGEKLLEEDKTNSADTSEDEELEGNSTAVQLVARELSNIGDELCRLHALRHRSYQQQQQHPVGQRRRTDDTTVVRNLPTLVRTQPLHERLSVFIDA